MKTNKPTTKKKNLNKKHHFIFTGGLLCICGLPQHATEYHYPAPETKREKEWWIRELGWDKPKYGWTREKKIVRWVEARARDEERERMIKQIQHELTK